MRWTLNRNRLALLPISCGRFPSGALELRLDDTDGPLLGRAVVEPSGAYELAAGRHPIRVDFFERGGGAGVILRWKRGGTAKEAVPASVLDLEARYYELDDPTTLPDFDKLTPYATGVVEQINYPSTNSAFADSGRAEHVGAVFVGHLIVETSGAYTFFLESDDGSRLTLDGETIINNDGLHGMVEKSAAMRWTDIRVPITDPGGTHALYVVYRANGGHASPMKLNWIEFEGRGVTETEGSERQISHDH